MMFSPGKKVQRQSKHGILKCLFFILLLLLAFQTYSQNEANIWYFGEYAGLDFNSGEPQVIPGHTWNHRGTSVYSDTLGNLLFYSDGIDIFNKNHHVMVNGEDLAGGSYAATQRVLFVKQPQSDNLFYVFIVGRGAHSNTGLYGLWYNIVDINGNNGLGEVIERDVFLSAAYDAQEKLFAVKHENKEDIWVVTRKIKDDKFASFLLTASGLNIMPVLSDAHNMQHIGENTKGYMKVSYDKKYLLAAYMCSNPARITEVCKFNAATGVIDFLYYEMKLDEQGRKLAPFGIEFSPDSKYAYIAFTTDDNDVDIYQYDMQYIENAGLFTQSAIKISSGPGQGLQLATDGKIYCSHPESIGGPLYHYVSVIHKPWERGLACSFEADAIDMGDNIEVWECFPNFLLDHLYRFEWEGTCSGPDNGFSFQPNFIPTPESITWNFNDPDAGADSISTELYPVHYFTHGGEFEVSVVVHYPPTPNYQFGRIEETSRVVEVKESPHPNLGPDTVVCEGTEVTLNAGSEEGTYAWSDGTFGHNIFTLTVADTGIHWVQVSNSEGCSTRDSLHLGWFNKAVFDESNLEITPTSCGGSNGSISGLAITGAGPFGFNWLDGNGNLIGNTIDIDNLSVGNYFLHVSDTNNCITVSNSFTVTDAGNIIINDVSFISSHCSQSIGSISIVANLGAGNDFLYSIDNGTTWQTDSIFADLPSGDYFIRVKDSSGCETVFDNNPVTIKNIEGPQISIINATPENDYASDGSINIEAFIYDGDIRYSIDSGYTFQVNDGLFENLTAGTYFCVVKDDFACDTTFTIELDRIISQVINAIAGDGSTCIGNATASPLLLSNFDGVSRFHAMLTYDKDLLTCEGYMMTHPDLEDSLVVSTNNSGEVHISWQGQSPVSLPDNSLMTELVFSAICDGLSQVDWVAEQCESQFFNENDEQINTVYELGYILVYTRPNIFLSPTNEVCEGETLIVVTSVEGGSGINTSYWVGPDNFTSNSQLLWFNEVAPEMSGTYILTVTDSLNCVESKSMELIVNESPEIAFSQDDTLWVEPGYILEAGSNYNNVYQWNTGETSPEIAIDSTGLYHVRVTSLQNCSSTDTVQILWGGSPFYLPNAFTPNGDGLNDMFAAIPKHDIIDQFLMIIYNRWGQLLFETKDINQGWDGTYKGSPCMMGAYIYRIDYKELGQQPVESKVVEGTVLLVR
jgi:gliding motility-associated-like protein